ncbi:MAG: aspartate aminotransferase family protein [Rhodospirillales bacterium]|nr:aspartate aminotransferase family protein [Rhodospirillales bacterium]MDH3790853.1 aspartate aminotransferase family protein [Rhodospirillales bacterium]MDH3919375.1 aspartate aminotransferase family protein [Rhodospirillales bacterium]
MTSLPVRNSTAQWRATDLAHHLHPFTDTKALAKEGGSRIIVKAEGAWLEDSEGQRILDAMAGLWCVNVGFGRKELAEAAYRQMLELPYYNTFFKTATPPSIELSEKLAALTPADLRHVFFASSGSEANDTIVRMVRHYWNLEGKPGKKTFISRHEAYHGSTMAAASLGGMSAMHGQADLPLPGFVHVMAPHWYDHGGDLDPEDFGRAAAKAVEDKILELGADQVAAFIGEPIMGAGGVLVPPDSYWPEIQRICRAHDVLLIADEVICGFGRLGHWFGSDLYGIEPDIMPMAKGLTSGYLPLSAVLVGDRVAGTLIDEGGEFYHGFTYSGHPVACAVALENIRILEDEKLIERVREDTGPYLQQTLRAALEGHPLVGEVRGVGLIGAIELVEDRATRKHFEPVGRVGGICREHCFANNLIMRAVRDAMVFSPPLTLSHEEIDELVKRARHCIDLTAKDLGVL